MTADIAAAGNLPAEPNSFIGRGRDLTELARMLGKVRVLTLCGPGGIGKTRLSVRLAGQVAERFPGGTWLVPLADTSDPGQLPGPGRGTADHRAGGGPGAGTAGAADRRPAG